MSEYPLSTCSTEDESLSRKNHSIRTGIEPASHNNLREDEGEYSNHDLDFVPARGLVRSLQLCYSRSNESNPQRDRNINKPE